MSSEFDDLIEETPPEPLDAEDAGGAEAASTTRAEPPLMMASQLLDPADEDMGDFEPGGRYRGFQILPRHLWPDEPQHARWGETRFYVTSPSGAVGMVPWAGSVIVWPWDAAWNLDLHREQVQTFLKDDEKKGRKK